VEYESVSNVNQFQIENLSKGKQVIPLLEERDTQWVNALTPNFSKLKFGNNEVK